MPSMIEDASGPPQVHKWHVQRLPNVVQKRFKRFKKVQEDPRMFKKIQEESRRFNKFREGSRK